MPKFKQTLTAYYDVIVEAEDMYEADSKVAAMSEEDVVTSGRLTYVDFDTSEFPEEY